MAISIKRYIDITSGIGAGARVAGRDLIGRLYSTSGLLPMEAILEFETAPEVMEWFGPDTEEYRRAAFYFGFISKTQTRPRKLGFARWARTATAASLRGRVPVPALAQFKLVTDGAITFNLGDNQRVISGLDFSVATAYADVASAIQGGLRNADSDPLWAESVVTYDARLKSFIFTAGQTGACAITPAADAETGTPLAGMLRWNAGSSALASPGYDPQTVSEALNSSADQSNNFGSFAFVPELTLAEMGQAAEFSHLSNCGFLYCQAVDAANAADVQAALKDYDGTALTLREPLLPGEYPEMAPMALLAATDYTRRSGTINYMFQQLPGLTPTVTDNAAAGLMDSLRVNYYGRTQQAGQLIDFYQRGLLQGSIADMNVYANEMWLKDRAGADIMTLNLALNKISANSAGKAALYSALQNVVDLALNNGAISVGKTLTPAQKAFIYQVTGDDTAWTQIENQGWRLEVEIQESIAQDGRAEYKAVYLLLYAKDDLIRKVEGTHSLI